MQQIVMKASFRTDGNQRISPDDLVMKQIRVGNLNHISSRIKTWPSATPLSAAIIGVETPDGQRGEEHRTHRGTKVFRATDENDHLK
jgi:hypothetical protein